MPATASTEGSLQGRTAVIFGASRGIGAATATALCSAGARVALASRDHAALEQLAGALRAQGGEALVVPTDVLDEVAIGEAVAATVRTFGRLDIAVNNAGISPRRTLMADLATADFEHVMAINVRSAFIAMKHEIRAMLLAGGGSIVNTASVGSLVGLAQMAGYTASKHALVGLTRSAALDYASSHIRINAVAPGTTMTEMLRAGGASTPEGEARLRAATPLGRIAGADEIAAAILWLCTDAASFVTGATLPVDGGYTVG